MTDRTELVRFVARCEGCYCEVAVDRRRCFECGDVLRQSIASGIVYTATYIGVLGFIVAGSWSGIASVMTIGTLAFWRTRLRMRELRRAGPLPRASLLLR